MRWLVGLGLVAVLVVVAISDFGKPKNEDIPIAIIQSTLPERISPSTAEGGLPSEAPPSGDGSLVLTVRDQAGRTPEGISVSIEGPIQGLRTTDSSGKVSLDLPAGYYQARVMDGCYEGLQVLQGGSSRLGIAAGQTTAGELSTQWRHQYAPDAPVHSTYTPHWPIGRDTNIRYTVFDRCKDNQTAPNATFPTFEFQYNDEIVIVGQPQLRADSDAIGHLTVRCQKEGFVKLWMVDKSNPDDYLDVADKSSDSGLDVECKNF